MLSAEPTTVPIKASCKRSGSGALAGCTGCGGGATITTAGGGAGGRREGVKSGRCRLTLSVASGMAQSGLP
jgi:hypothetical protein